MMKKISLSSIVDENIFQPKEAGFAIESLGYSYKWEELKSRVNRLATYYRNSMGLTSRDTIVSYVPNSPELFIHYLACYKLGVVIFPLNIRFNISEIAQAVKLSKCKYILVSRNCSKDMIDLILNRFDSRLLYLEDLLNKSLEDKLELSMEKRDEVETNSNTSDPISIYMTSGSTGNPKGVTHTYESLENILTSIVENFSIDNNDILFPAATGFSTYLFSLAALSQGAQVVINGVLNNEQVINILRETKPTIFGMPATNLERLLDEPNLEPEDFDSVRLCLLGGDKISEKLIHKFKKYTSLDILEGYGMTEFGVSHNNLPENNKLGSFGKIFSNYYEYTIRDKNMNEVANGNVGELWIKSPCLMLNYWKNDTLTKQSFYKDWFRTGDLVRVDNDGFFWFHGRIKQTIIHLGTNISPQEIEEVLLKHEAISKAAVIGIRDNEHGQSIHAFIVLDSTSKNIDFEELKKFCLKYVAVYKVPTSYDVIDDLPYTTSGKINRNKLLKRKTAANNG